MVTRNDIGGELISILTKGIYSDPRDTLREYIQNGVDAGATKINVRLRSNNIYVIDDGNGMDSIIMRRAIRVGMSDKDPTKSVGFMGIGLYSSFHLCDEMAIYSRVENKKPNKLTFDFKSMRNSLEQQRLIRLTGKKPQQQLDLQTLLNDSIKFIVLNEDEFPLIGTRVELSGLEPNFYKSLSKFDELAKYLESVIPLPFSPDFSRGAEVQEQINKICKENHTSFKTVNVYLDIDTGDIPLYRPYRDSDFINKDQGSPLKPKFFKLENRDGFLGLAWGCLNSAKDTIANEDVRGFAIKKQGFTIGKRGDLIKYFKRQTFFNRYVGEFLALHPKLLPNAPRSDFEYSDLRSSFYAELVITAKKFNDAANEYQEQEKAEEELSEAISYYNEVASQLPFFANNSDKLLEFFQDTNSYASSIAKRIKLNKFRKSAEEHAQDVLKKINGLKAEIKQTIDKKRITKSSQKQSSATLKRLITEGPRKPKEPELGSLNEVLAFYGFELTDDLRAIANLIDQKFIKAGIKSMDDYFERLDSLKEDIDEYFEENE